MRLELTRVGLLVELANHYTTRGAYCQQNYVTPGQIRVPTNTADRSMSRLSLGGNLSESKIELVFMQEEEFIIV